MNWRVPRISRDEETGEWHFNGRHYDSREDADEAREDYQDALDNEADRRIKSAKEDKLCE